MFTLLRQNSIIRTVNHQITRSFLTNQQLGLDKYRVGRDFNLADKETIVENIKNSLNNNGLVYTNDLRRFIYTVDSKEDANLLKEAVIKFASEGNSIRLVDFKVGPVIARALYSIDDLDTLEELVKNEKTREHFEVKTAQNIYLSFLYKKGKYIEALDHAEPVIKKTMTSDTNFPASVEFSNLLIIYLASAYKLGNKDALERSRSVMRECIEKFNEKRRRDGKPQTLRMKQIMLYHLLCLKNNELAEALEILSSLNFLDRYEFLNARAAILVKLGRFDECLADIKNISENKRNDGKPKYVFTETIDIIKKELEKNPHEALSEKINSLTQDLILDANIEDTILALPNAQQRKNSNFRSTNQGRFENRGGYRQDFSSNDFNRFGNRNQGFNRFGNQNQGFNRFDDRQGFKRFGGNRSQDFESNRFNEFDNDGSSRRNFRPFQTRFKEETSDLI